MSNFTTPTTVLATVTLTKNIWWPDLTEVAEAVGLGVQVLAGVWFLTLLYFKWFKDKGK